MDDLRQQVNKVRQDWPEESRKYEATRYVRFLCDYTCEGVSAKGGGMTSPMHFPFSIELIDRIYRWQETYEGFWRWERDGMPVPEDAMRAFTDEGRAIAVAAKRELPDWTIIYHDERRCGLSIALRFPGPLDDDADPEAAVGGNDAAPTPEPLEDDDNVDEEVAMALLLRDEPLEAVGTGEALGGAWRLSDEERMFFEYEITDEVMRTGRAPPHPFDPTP